MDIFSFRAFHITGICLSMVCCTRGDYSKSAWAAHYSVGGEEKTDTQSSINAALLVLNQPCFTAKVETLPPFPNNVKANQMPLWPGE